MTIHSSSTALASWCPASSLVSIKARKTVRVPRGAITPIEKSRRWREKRALGHRQRGTLPADALLSCVASTLYAWCVCLYRRRYDRNGAGYVAHSVYARCEQLHLSVVYVRFTSTCSERTVNVSSDDPGLTDDVAVHLTSVLWSCLNLISHCRISLTLPAEASMDWMPPHSTVMLGVTTASVSVVERALAAGASADGMPLFDSVPPLCFASNRGYIDIIKLLVHRGADLEVATVDGRGLPGSFRVLLDGGSRKVPLTGSKSLHAAVYGGKTAALRVLLEAGASPNSTDAHGVTPLMVACATNPDDLDRRPYFDAEQRIEALHALLNAGADPTVRDQNGQAATHYAAGVGDISSIELLLAKAPSTINEIDNTGCTPLGMAASSGQASTVSFLLSAGAREPTVCSSDTIRKGALLLAVKGNRQTVVRVMLEQGLEAVGGLALVPEALRSSVQRGFIGIIWLLLNVQGEERQRFWANYHVFAEFDFLAYVAMIPAGTPLGRVNEILMDKFSAAYRTPLLHLAAKYCSLRATHALLSADADEHYVVRGDNCWSEDNRASDVVGEWQESDEGDATRESALRRMLQRGPAFRARSWAWPAEAGPPVVAVALGAALKFATSVRRHPILRLFRAKGRWCFTRRCAR